MFAKTFVLLFVAYNLQPIQSGSVKYALLLKQPPQVQEVINNIHYQMDSISGQFELVNLRLKTSVSAAKINSKLTLKQFQLFAKSVKDETCGPAAKHASKTIDDQLDALKTCNEKDAIKLLKTQIFNYLKTLNSQANVVDSYCHLMHTGAEEVENCVSNSVQNLNEELEDAKKFSADSVEQLSQNGEGCVNDVIGKFEDSIKQATSDIDVCLNPPTPAPESNESEESKESDESNESNVTEDVTELEDAGTTEGRSTDDCVQESSEAPQEAVSGEAQETASESQQQENNGEDGQQEAGEEAKQEGGEEAPQVPQEGGEEAKQEASQDVPQEGGEEAKQEVEEEANQDVPQEGGEEAKQEVEEEASQDVPQEGGEEAKQEPQQGEENNGEAQQEENAQQEDKEEGNVEPENNEGVQQAEGEVAQAEDVATQENNEVEAK